MRKVLLLNPVGEHGGAEAVLLSIAKNLIQFGWDPHFVCLRPGPLVDMAREQGLNVYAYPDQYRYRQLSHVVKSARWVAGLAKKVGAEVIHSNLTSHVTGGLASRLCQIPEVWHLYDIPRPHDRMDKIQQMMGCRHVIFLTDDVRRGYSQLANKRPNTVVLPNCVDYQTLRSWPEDPNIRGKFGIPPGPMLVKIARMQGHKGHPYLISAIPKVLQRHPNTQVVFIGKPNGAEQEEYRRQLEMQAQELGFEGNLHFLGYVEEQDRVNLCREATALVHAATTESYGLVLVEAMALGTPVLAANAAGPASIIEHGQNGLLVPIRDSDALAEAACRLLDDAELRNTLAKHGLEWTKKHNAHEMTSQVVSIYDAVTSR